MVSTSARLLALLGLLQTRRDWPGAVLAGRLQVDVRTVRRDIDRLRELGYRIDASAGQGGGYRLGPGPTLPPVLLTDDEAVTVMLALHAAAGSVSGLEAASQGLLAKLDHLMPTRLRTRVRTMDAITVSLAGCGDLAGIDALAIIASACRDRHRLRLRYTDRGGQDSQRHVEPQQLVHTGRRWYLLAWDLGRADWRTFRIDRMREPVSDGSIFEPRTLPDDPARFVARALASAPSRYRLWVRLQGNYDELAVAVPGWCGLLEAIDQRSCRLQLGADSLEGMAASLLMVGRDLQLLESPPWLPQLRAVAGRLRDVAQAGPAFEGAVAAET